jgi:hypothetical protein
MIRCAGQQSSSLFKACYSITEAEAASGFVWWSLWHRLNCCKLQVDNFKYGTTGKTLLTARQGNRLQGTLAA